MSVKCASCNTDLKFPKSWWYSCYHCGFPIELTKLLYKLKTNYPPYSVTNLMTVIQKTLTQESQS